MNYRFEDFQACLDQPFELYDGDYQETLQLVSTERLPNAHASDGREAFSILFQSGNHEALPQKMYRLVNENIGDLDLFIVPVDDSEHDIRYEAVFS